MRAELEERVLEMVSERAEVPVAELTADTRLEDLGFDSLVLAELSVKLRKELGVQASDDELDFVDSVGELLELVTKAKAG
jgi:acyl carrier protein